MYCRYLLYPFFLIFLVNSSNSQKTVTVDYRHPISDDYSYNEELIRALERIKEEALRKGGIGENVMSYRTIWKTTNNKNFRQAFSSDIISNIQGTIENWEYVQTPQKGYDEELDNFFINLSIKAKVKKYKTDIDPQFVARVEGIQYFYNVSEDVNDNLNIQITPSQDCYMKIFYVHGTSAEIVFPIKVGANGKDYPIFRDEILPKDYTKTIDYLAPELEENEDSSQGKLIFVLTKKPYDYVDSEIDEDGYYTKTQINLIFDWIMKIEPGDRVIYYEQFNIGR